MTCWQDIVIMMGCFLLSGALIPTILGRHKPEPLTSALSGGVLAVMTVCFATLGLWLSTIAEGICALLWFILLIQVFQIKRRT